MSAPSADPSTNARRDSALGIVGIAGGFLLIAGIFVWMWISRGHPIDAADQLRGSFAVSAVPAGWNVALAQAVPDGFFDFSSEQRIVRLVRADAPADPAPSETPEAKPDWKALAEKAAAGEPTRLFLAWYPPSSGSQDVQRQLDSHRAQELSQLGEKGGIVRIDVGKLTWGSFDADFVHERLFEKGAFRDALRVNLSSPGQFCVLNVLWPWGVRGSRESASKVLALFPPHAPAPAPAGK